MNSECTLEEYYTQFATDRTLPTIIKYFGKAKLKRWDPKEIPGRAITLKEWDNCPLVCNTTLMKEAGECLTLSVKVCILKVCAEDALKRGLFGR